MPQHVLPATEGLRGNGRAELPITMADPEAINTLFDRPHDSREVASLAPAPAHSLPAREESAASGWRSYHAAVKRRAGHIGLLLLAWGAAGAIVNVAVAWWSSVRNCSDNAIYARYSASVPRPISRSRLPGQPLSPADSKWLERMQFKPKEPANSCRFETTKVTFRGFAFQQVAYTEWTVPLVAVGGLVWQPLSPFAVQSQCGWPLLALADHLWDDHPDAPRSRSFLSVNLSVQSGKRWHHRGGFAFERESDRIALPYVPIWPGFAINTVFYAFVLWLLFAAPFALRRRRRSQRGLCPKCAYPVGQSHVCTECGHSFSKSFYLMNANRGSR